MKKLLLLLSLLSLPCLAFAANVTIKDIATTAVLPTANDYTVFDGSTSGTRKILASRVTFTVTIRTALAALSITNAADGAVVYVLGATSTGDGGGSPYYWSAASTATPNGNTVILPASAPGTGRWLKAASASGLPGASTLGGVFSNAGASHSFVTAINTDGTITLAQPAIGDITGLGSMASQNSSAVAITGGTFSGSTVTASGALTGLTLALTGSGVVINDVNGTTNATTGALGNANGTVVWGTAADGHGYVGTSSNTLFYFRANNSEVGIVSPTGLNSMAIGVTTPANGFFTGLSANGKTIILGGNFTTSGAFNSTFTMTGTTAVTFPTSGTLLTAATAPSSIAGTANEIAASASVGAITLSLPSALTFTSKTVTGGTFNATAFNGPLGGTTPAVVHATTIDSSSNANIRTTKGSFNLVVNVRDYGAVGNGSTDDTTAVNAAIAALASYGTLYFGPGNYKIAGTLSAFSGMTGVTIQGLGATLYNTGHGNTLVIDRTCNNITVENLRFTGDASVRANGVHIRIHSDNSRIINCYFQGCSDFGLFIGYDDTVSACNGVSVIGCAFNATLGDGCHVMNANNTYIGGGTTFISTGDDSIGLIADVVGKGPQRTHVSGVSIFNSGSRGIAMEEVIDVLIDDVKIYTTVLAAIEVGRYTSTSAYNTRVSIKNCKIYNAMTTAGPLGGIWLKWISQGDCSGNQIIDTVHGSSIAFLDINEFAIAGNFARQSQSRGIASDDTTTANVGSTWNSIWITNNNLDWVVANQAIYAVPASGKTITNLTVTGNTGVVLPSGDWIYYERVTGGRIWNNTNMNSRTVGAGGTVSAITAGNNN